MTTKPKTKWDPNVRFISDILDDPSSGGYFTIITRSTGEKEKRTCWTVRVGEQTGYIILPAEETSNISYWSPLPCLSSLRL